MKPETVLRLKDYDNFEDIKENWITQYLALAEEYPEKSELCNRLINRVKRAAEMIGEGKNSVGQANGKNELDGEFLLGNEEDASFVNNYFTIEQLAKIQVGLKYRIATGNYVEPDYGTLVRKGIIAELNGEYLFAMECYGGVPLSPSVQEREFSCRKKAEVEGDKLYKTALEMIKNNDGKIYGVLERAAEMGSVDALYELGVANARGKYGCHCSEKIALEYLRKAADKNCARACYAITELYDDGCKISAEEAKKMCTYAANLGCEEAAARLKKGFDLRPLRVILNERIDNGDIKAIWQMYEVCAEENDMDEAAEWFWRAVEANQTDALMLIGGLCADKNSSWHDEIAAEKYYKRAADKGNIEAMKLLGDMSLSEAVQPFWSDTADKTFLAAHKKQMEWYRRAAEKGDENAAIYLCRAIRRGYPERLDDAELKKWASVAVNSCVEATFYLGEICERENNLKEAVSFYEKAAEGGIIGAMLKLYEIYKSGNSVVEKDEQKAAKYLFMSGIGRD